MTCGLIFFWLKFVYVTSQLRLVQPFLRKILDPPLVRIHWSCVHSVRIRPNNWTGFWNRRNTRKRSFHLEKHLILSIWKAPFDLKIFLKPMTHSSTSVDQRMLQLLSNKMLNIMPRWTLKWAMNTVEHFVVRQMLIVSYWLYMFLELYLTQWY